MKHLIGIVIFSFLSLNALAEENPTHSKISLEAGLGYNSNPYSLTNVEIDKTGKSPGDMMARLAPKFSLISQGRKLAVTIDGNANMAAMFGINQNPGFVLFDGGANGSSTYNTGGVVSFFTQGNLNASRNLGELFVGNMTNLTGRAVLGSTYRPGGGKLALTFQGEYQVQGYPGLLYQNKESVPALLNNQAYYLASRLSWQFLPKTALYAEGRYGFYENIDSNQVSLTINPLWVGAGLTGRITPNLVANVSAHFSRIFIRDGSQTLTGTSFPVGAKIGLDWNLASHGLLSVNLIREMTPAPIFLDQVSNSLTLKYNQTLWEKWAFSLQPQFGVLEYGKPDTTLSTTNYRIQSGYENRLDLFTGVQLACTYSFNEWLAVGASGDGFWRWTNTDPAQVLTQLGWVADGNGKNFQTLFSRYQGNAFVRLTY